MQKNEFYAPAVSYLGEKNIIGDQHMPAIESFMCALYGRPRILNVNDVRYEMSQQHVGPKNVNDPIGKLKEANPSSKTSYYAIRYC